MWSLRKEYLFLTLVPFGICNDFVAYGQSGHTQSTLGGIGMALCRCD